MDRPAVLAAYDAQIRRNPAPAPHIEREPTVVRHVSAAGGWNAVIWSDTGSGDADAMIAAQIDHFAGSAGPWEWKYYSHDQPPDLPDRLLAAGFTAEPPETLLVAEIADLDLDVPPPDGVRLREVVDGAGVEALVAVHDAVFGAEQRALAAEVTAGLADGTVAAVVALAAGVPVGGGRVEFPAGTDFAGLWGGGTVPAWRGRGVFRALVAHRAAAARARGFRYLQVDAAPASRPILVRMGFVELATTIPFLHPGGPAPTS